ncbi:MAG: GFA family protein [Gammaproteobacteria bacterium]|nr:MAG: GFA family protein [Gammaproteobacteria bacterium]
MVKTYRASCHCSRVAIEVQIDLTQSSYRCNCSICRRNRFWPAVARPEQFRMLSGESELTRYIFGSGRNHHFFCRHCGVRVFGVGNDTPIGTMYGINIGCLEEVDEAELSRIPITYVDGLHDRWGEAPEFTRHL